MKKGLWRVNGETIIFNKSGELSNGQHRLSACVEANTPFLAIVLCNVDDDAFATIDTGKIRSGGDVLYLSGVEKYSNKYSSIITRYLGKESSVASLLRSENARKYGVSKTEIKDFYLEHKELLDDIVPFACRLHDKNHLLTHGTIGSLIMVLILDYKWDVTLVKDFFEKLFNGNSEISSIKLLYNILVKHSNKTDIKTNNQIICYFVKAWNAYVRNDEISVIRAGKDEKVPQILYCENN